MGGTHNSMSCKITKNRYANCLLAVLVAAAMLFGSTSCNPSKQRLPVRSQLSIDYDQNVRFKKLGRARAQFERADLEKNGGINLDNLACGPVVLFPVGESNEILNFVNLSGEKGSGGLLVLSREVDGRPTRIFKANLVVLRKNSQTLKGTVNCYLAGQGCQIADNAPKAAFDYASKIEKGFACYQSIYPIGTINCQFVYPDGKASSNEELDSDQMAKNGYPISRAEASQLRHP